MAEAREKHTTLEKGINALMYKHLPQFSQKFNEQLNDYVLLQLEDLAGKRNIDLADIESLLEQNPNLIETLNRRHTWSLLSSQPVSLLIYALVTQAKFELKRIWSDILPDSELEPYYRDLGIPFD